MLSLPHQVVMRIKGDKVDELLKGYIRHQGSLFIDKDILWIPFLTSVRAALWWEVPWTGRGGLESFLPCSLLCAAFGSNPFTLLVPRGLIFKRGLDLDEWSECGHRTSSISITWKLAGNVDFQSQLGAISCLIGREELGVLQGVHWARRREKWTPRGLSLASLEVRTDENCLGLHLPSQFQLWGCFSGLWKLIEGAECADPRGSWPPSSFLSSSPDGCHCNSAPTHISQTSQAHSQGWSQSVSGRLAWDGNRVNNVFLKVFYSQITSLQFWGFCLVLHLGIHLKIREKKSTVASICTK